MPYLSFKIRRILFLFVDALLIVLAVYLAFFLRFDGQIPDQYLESALWLAIITSAIYLSFFYFSHLYVFFWEYVSTNELIALAKSTTLSLFTLVALIFVFRDERIFIGIPRSTIFISYILIFIFCGGVRFTKRFYLQIFKGASTEGRKRTLIVGIDDATEQFLRTTLGSKKSPYLPIGLVDGNSARKGETIHGVPILGGVQDTARIIAKNIVETMMVSVSFGGPIELGDVIAEGRKAGLKDIKFIDPSDKKIRDFQVEDLFQGKNFDERLIKDFILGKTILVTGAAGSIGSELCRQIAKFSPSSLLILDQDETGVFNISEELKKRHEKLKIFPIICDVQDKDKITKIFEKFQPKIIFHAAAYKHVPLMEENPDEAVKNNVFGTKIVAEAALRAETEKFIFISTDKAVNPTSVMGRTKRIGEMICQALTQRGTTQFISVRFGNVLDSRGSVIPIFREQIRKGGPIEVTHPDMERYFMLIAESCLLVMEAGALGKGGDIFVLDMGKQIKILDLAKEMIKFSGLTPDEDIPIVFIGIRPGEKLFEEILTAEEGTVATQYQKIFIAKPPKIDEGRLKFNLKKLKNEVQRTNKEGIKDVLKKITAVAKKR